MQAYQTVPGYQDIQNTADCEGGPVPASRLDPDTEKGSRKLLREPSQLTDKRKLLIGLVIVLIIACSWVGSTQTAKSSYTNGFSAPYFVTWFSTCWMILVFPLTAPLYFITRRAKVNTRGVCDLFR